MAEFRPSNIDEHPLFKRGTGPSGPSGTDMIEQRLSALESKVSELPTRAELWKHSYVLVSFIVVAFGALGFYLNAINANINARFDAVDSRFESMDSRFESIDSRFLGVENKLASMDNRLNQMAVEQTAIRKDVESNAESLRELKAIK